MLTQDNKTMNDGINTIQAVARAVHKDLNPAVAAKTTSTIAPPAAPQEAVPAVPEAPAVRMLTATPRP